MDALLNFISIAVPLIFAACIFRLKNMTMEMKISLWIICALIIILDAYLIIKDKKIKEEKSKREELYNRLYERQELFDRNLPRVLMDNLERNSLLTDFFHTGQKYEKKYNFNKAIKVYRECLNNSDVPEEEKITLNVLIGNCIIFYLN